jgi:hypothetical protein
MVCHIVVWPQDEKFLAKLQLLISPKEMQVRAQAE